MCTVNIVECNRRVEGWMHCLTLLNIVLESVKFVTCTLISHENNVNNKRSNIFFKKYVYRRAMNVFSSSCRYQLENTFTSTEDIKGDGDLRSRQ